MEPKDIKIFDKNIMTVFEQIKADIFQTRGKVLADANKELLSMYFRIGKMIVDKMCIRDSITIECIFYILRFSY